MQVQYTQNENCYVLTNFSDSNNPMFTNEFEIQDFKVRVEKHLSPICDIMGFCFHNDQYIILVRLKERAEFLNFYRKKKKEENLREKEIPESTFILSQEMANLQAGYAKAFNFRHNRYGSLFGRRYTKILVQNEEELKTWKDQINGRKRIWTFDELWSWIKNFIRDGKEAKKLAKSSEEVYGAKSALEAIMLSGFSSFLRVGDFLLRGKYLAKPLPPHLQRNP